MLGVDAKNEVKGVIDHICNMKRGDRSYLYGGHLYSRGETKLAKW